MCHCYVRNDGLSSVCITDAEYQQRVAMSFLGRVLDDFTSKVPAVQWVRDDVIDFLSLISKFSPESRVIRTALISD